ncbi:hypothetical protein [Bradyrhizobium sp.]|uniref:hypothetical protein n=1 Tax=Bradyrhizobium sp. TaxID=376 RepID=UPI003C69ADFE
MATETIKVLLMIFMFGILEAALHFDRTRAMRHWAFVRNVLARLAPAEAPTDYNLLPVRIRREHRKH